MTGWIRTKKFSAIIIVVIATLTITSSTCKAQRWSRSGKTELYVIGQHMREDSSMVEGSSVAKTVVNETTSAGLGIGLNWDDHININTELLYGYTEEHWGPGGHNWGKEDHKLWIWNLNLDYYFEKDRFTPLITGGIGAIHFDGWDENEFSANLGLGVRWDASDNLFFKGVYRAIWTELKGTEDEMDLGGFMFTVGYMF
jgi:opacity protein-like surface antigen